ncbi:MAG: TMEM165/GDT1 family protein [Methanotrichaceae archaeon]|nr:TMEM165/GDT1 family protein [Methanotrichaceae archaeon]
MLSDILVPFLAISLAELGDKTQLSILLLSVKTKDHLRLLAGVMLAFLLVDGAAIVAGSWATTIISVDLLRKASGLLFILFGLLILRDLDKSEEDGGNELNRSPFVSGFALIFLAEWGDKTQLASALFATQYNPWLVFAGTIAALALLSATAIYLGQAILARVEKRLVSKAAAVVFVLMGLYLLIPYPG